MTVSVLQEAAAAGIPLQTILLGSLVALAALALAWHASTPARANGKLPPGPKGALLSGNALQLRVTHPWRQMKEWTEKYGEIYTVRLGPNKLLFVCGTATSANELLDKQSGITSDRPRQIMGGELLSGGKRMLIMRYNERWRAYRKAMHEALQDKSAKTYEPIQIKESRIAMLNLGRDPKAFRSHFSRYAASVIMTVTYDHPVQSLNDPLVKAVNERLDSFAKWIKPAASPLDSVPFLEYLPLPLNPWKREGLRLHKLELDLFLSLFLDVRRRVKSGEANECFVSKLQEKQKALGLTDEEAAYLAGSLFGAGSDTTASAISIFVMAMIRTPAVHDKAQEELDRVIGDERMPTFDDLPSLPYIRATLKETLRWRPVSSGGFSHQLTEDTEYKGYVLPKGSAVVGNHWSISLDPVEYPEPDIFKPERFLDSTHTTDHGTWFAKERGSIAFGFGRRICPGQHVAERSLFINIACLLWAFDMRAPNGRPEEVDTLAFTGSANSHPLPFEAEIRYRSEKRRKVVEDEAREIGEVERGA